VRDRSAQYTRNPEVCGRAQVRSYKKRGGIARGLPQLAPASPAHGPRLSQRGDMLPRLSITDVGS